MATYRISYPGNTALQQEVWNIPLHEAKAALALLQPSKGSYWESNLLKPYRRAVRAKQEHVRVYTAGFSSSELSNVLFNVDAKVTRTH